MKDYKKVIAERYDKQTYDGKGIKENMYSLINPTGFYGEFQSAKVLYEFVNMLAVRNKSWDMIKVCDCGCGGENKTRLMAELLGNPNQVYGIEYSKNRLQSCKSMNNYIHYEFADITVPGKGIPFEIQFDGVTAFVVFMHFSKEKDIISALQNIYDSLKKRGLFLWYEANADSHREGRAKDIDGWGFASKEMDKYASKVGFRLIRQYGVYTQIPVINTATVYLAKDIKNMDILGLLERLPFKKNNNVRIYCKE